METREGGWLCPHLEKREEESVVQMCPGHFWKESRMGKRELCVRKISVASCLKGPGLSRRTSARGADLCKVTGGKETALDHKPRGRWQHDPGKSHHPGEKGFGLDQLHANFFPTELVLPKKFHSETYLGPARVRRDFP